VNVPAAATTPKKSAVSTLLDNPATVRKWLKILAIVTLLEAAILLGNIYIHAHMERRAMEEAAANSTRARHTDDRRVCGRLKLDDTFMTFASAKRARMYNEEEKEEESGAGTGGGERGESVDIVHCGPCGRCSTTADLAVLARTHCTLTDTVRGCSVRAFLGSVFLLRGAGVYRSLAKRCLESSSADVGFSPPCEDCWLDNMVCDVQRCAFTCLKSVYIDRDPKNVVVGDDGATVINRCYECDELLCGPAFVDCAGANRRRMGVRTDLSRDDETELCQSVDVDWNAYVQGNGDGGGDSDGGKPALDEL